MLVAMPEGKTLASIVLPEDVNLHIFAVALG
jgi:hypothetical protein